MSGAMLCVECGDAAEVRLAVTPLCVTCWRSITNPWRERCGIPLIGRGHMLGAPRPDGWALVRCIDCGYSWFGPPGERCDNCARITDNRRKWQAELVLTPPDVDPDDRNRDARLAAWAERLARAVEVDLITEAQARRALDRVVEHVAA